jgi:uncharacterized membrane protein YkvA (DUF1232 family)
MLIAQWRTWARGLKVDTYALYLAYRDPRVRWYARVFAVCVVAYAFSPIDLIPDFIPVLGYVDDLILVPIGIWLAIRMIPAEVMAQSRARAQHALRADRPTNWAVGAAIIAVWLLIVAVVTAAVVRAVR